MIIELSDNIMYILVFLMTFGVLSSLISLFSPNCKTKLIVANKMNLHDNYVRFKGLLFLGLWIIIILSVWGTLKI